MAFLRTLLSRCLGLFHHDDRELDDELQSHLEFAIEENRRRGLSEEEARRAALHAFGGLAQVREAYRLQSGVPLVEQTKRDLQFGLRQLRKSPGFALTAISTLALGLGANTAVFSLINGLLIRPLPVPHSSELALVHYTRADDPGPGYNLSAPLFRALEERHDIFQEVGGFTARKLQVRGASGTLEFHGALVSGQFFETLATPPLLGRYLTSQDDRHGGTSTGFGVVISEGFWRTWFHAAPDVVGRQLILANAPFTVVGVMPARFIGADPTQRPTIYAPLWAEPVIDAPYNNIAAGYHLSWIRVVARRNPGVSLEQASAVLRVATHSILSEAIPDAGWIKKAQAQHFQLGAESGSTGYSGLRDVFVKPLVAVFLLCAAMLLLACLNLTSLLMARSAARERELATRLAMGASRGRLIRQLLAESLLIALMGTAVGLIAAPLVSRSLAAFVLSNTSGTVLDTAPDLRVFGFVALTALTTTVLIGLIPALRATSGSLNEQIKHNAHSLSMQERRRALPRVLMGLEVALALILVVGAGLLATSLARLYRAGLGFDPDGVVNLALNMGKQQLEGDALVRWYHAFADAVSQLPGVRSVSFAVVTPMSGSVWTRGFHTPLSGGDHEIFMSAIAPAYFRVMRIPLLNGRDYQWNDTLSSGRKIILSQSAAKHLFPGRNPVGQFVSDDEAKYEVIAVVGDIRYASIRESAPPEAYLPIMQSDDSKPSYTTVVRSAGPVAPLAISVRALVARMTPETPAPVIMTMSSDIDASITSERMMAMLAIFFAACALLVTAIGLYGTLAYATARRTGEIGIRIALGAQRSEVLSLVFRENAWILTGGSLAGLAIALLVSRVLVTFLYGISTHDPWVLFESVAALTLIAGTASLLPALRAARIEPMAALRSE